MTKDVPGFVGNRIQLVMAAEAFRCVEEGIATPEAVDAIVRSSFGFRLGAFGPLQVSDLAGLDVYESVYDYLTAAIRGTRPLAFSESSCGRAARKSHHRRASTSTRGGGR